MKKAWIGLVEKVCDEDDIDSRLKELNELEG